MVTPPPARLRVGDLFRGAQRRWTTWIQAHKSSATPDNFEPLNYEQQQMLAEAEAMAPLHRAALWLSAIALLAMAAWLHFDSIARYYR
jgi:hypothetical protein